MYQMDETDYEILEILKGDGRCSYSDIAEQVHLSRVAVRERINNMKEGGVIRGFTVVIDAKAYQILLLLRIVVVLYKFKLAVSWW